MIKEYICEICGNRGHPFRLIGERHVIFCLECTNDWNEYIRKTKEWPKMNPALARLSRAVRQGSAAEVEMWAKEREKLERAFFFMSKKWIETNRKKKKGGGW